MPKELPTSLAVQGVQIQSLVRELRSHMPFREANKKKKEKKTNIPKETQEELL